MLSGRTADCRNVEQDIDDLLRQPSTRAEEELFLGVLKGMLHHTVLKRSGELSGPYLTAFNRICNQARPAALFAADPFLASPMAKQSFCRAP
jgi:hypothetical protein